jgi:hypothetical protein
MIKFWFVCFIKCCHLPINVINPYLFLFFLFNMNKNIYENGKWSVCSFCSVIRHTTCSHSNTIQIFLFPFKEPFRAEQLTKNLIQWLWIDYIDWKMTTFYETNKSKFNHTIDIVRVAFECMYCIAMWASGVSNHRTKGAYWSFPVFIYIFIHIKKEEKE